MVPSANTSNGTMGFVPPSNVDWIWAFKVLIVIIGLVGNLLVVITVLTSRRLREQSTFVLICSLSVVVVYALIAVIPFDIHSTIIGNWSQHLHPKLCAFNAVSAMFFYGSTALNTAMIVLNRYFATVWHGYAAVNSCKTLIGMLVVCYAVPIVCLIPFFVHVRSGFDVISMSCFVTGKWKYDRIVWTVCFLAFSLVLMAYCFVHIFIDNRRRRKHGLLTTSDDPAKQSEVKKMRGYFSEVKTVKMAAILFLLMLLRVPSLVIPVLVPREAKFATLNSLLIIALSSIMFYPFVYVLFSCDFRDACVSLFCCRRHNTDWTVRHRIPTEERSSSNTDTQF